MPVLRHIIEPRGDNLPGPFPGDIFPVEQHPAPQDLIHAKDGGGHLRAPRAHHAGHAQDLARPHLQAHIGKAVAAEALQLQHWVRPVVHRGLHRRPGLYAPLGIGGKQALHQILAGKAGHRALDGDGPVPHDGHMGGNIEHLRQAVGDVNDADALLPQVPHHFKQALHLVEGEGGGGLIQDEQPGVAQDAPEDLHQLLLGDGQAAGLPAQIQVPANVRHGVRQLLVQLRLAPVKADGDILLHVHVGEEKRLLGHHINAPGQGVGGPVQGHRLAVHGKPAAVMAVDAHDDLHQRRLACAVAADQGQHLAGHHVQVDALEHGVQAEGLIDTPHRKQGNTAPRVLVGFHLNSPIPLVAMHKCP